MITAPMVAKSLGYCPPEMDTCHMSPKSDVFSYGVVSVVSVVIYMIVLAVIIIVNAGNIYWAGSIQEGQGG